MAHRFKKIIVLVLIASTLTFAPAKNAEALFGIPTIVFDPVLKVLDGLKLSAQYIQNLALGIPGSGASTRAALKTAQAPCKGAKTAYEISNAADSFSGPEIIAGSAGELTKLQTKIVALTLVRNCYAAVQAAGDAGSTLAAVSGIQALQAISSDEMVLTLEITSMDKRLDDLKKLKTDAQKELWKAVSIRILYNVQQRITTNLVNKLVQKYRIDNYTRYADAVATQVYTVDFVNKNITSGQDQAIVRSILQNDYSQNSVLPQVRLKAQNALGFDPTVYDVYSDDYFVKMSRAGMGAANPYFAQLVAEDQAAKVKSSAAQLATQEVNSGNGFMPVRNCANVTSQQALYDSQAKQLSAEVDANTLILQRLQAQNVVIPGSVTDEDIAKAQAALAASESKLNNLPTTSKPFVTACEGITNPGVAVANFTNSFLQSNLTSANTPNQNNLPFFASFVENVASNFLTKVIEGGRGNMQYLGSQGITAGNILVNDAVGTFAETQQLKNSDAVASVSSVGFGLSPISGNQYQVSWDASSLPSAKSVGIQGLPSGNVTSNSLRGSMNVNIASAVTLTLTVYDGSQNVLTTSRVTGGGSTNPNALNLTDTNNINNIDNQVNQINDNLQQVGTIPSDPPPINNYEQCMANGGTDYTCRQQYGPPANSGTVYGAYAKKLTVPLRVNPVPLRSSN